MNWYEFFMRHVYLAASKSKDPRTKIGAILVKDNTVISEGYNGFPRGVQDLNKRYTSRKTKYNYVVHAEHNVILNCARNGISTLGTTLYTQGIPCKECAKAIIQTGVKLIITHSLWPNLVHCPNWVRSIKIGERMLDEAGIQISSFSDELGLEGFLDGKIIKV